MENRGRSVEGRGAWRSRIGFILAASGSAVGLGNLWKFPYLTYKFGGGTEGGGAGGFIIVYILCIISVCLPLMIAEILIGRRGKLNPVGSFERLRPGTPWKWTGALGVFTGFLILSYYAVVAGWSFEYIYKSMTWSFGDYDRYVSDEDVEDKLYDEFRKSRASIPFLKDLGFLDDKSEVVDDHSIEEAWKRFDSSPLKERNIEKGRAFAIELFRKKFPEESDFNRALKDKKLELFPSRLFEEFLSNPFKQVLYFFLFMAITVIVVIGGVSSGIERWNRILMPLLLLMLFILIVRVITLPGGMKALKFLFYPDLSSINFDTVLWALGQGFFSLSLGMGALLTYGSYLSKDERISTSSIAITCLDTLVALSASFIIFGSIFSYGIILRGSGIGNLFTAIPVIFLHMPAGRWMCLLFYFLTSFAALTSTISLQEVVSSYLIDEKGMRRKKAVILTGSIIFIVGIPCALSFNLLSNFRIFDKTIFELFDYFCANISLPMGGILISLFVGWVLTGTEKREELKELHPLIFNIWNLLIRFFTPVAIFIILVSLLMGRLSG